ncbi:MAG: ABC transporter substrate-binding protein [Thermoleophilaceae bacterium]
MTRALALTVVLTASLIGCGGGGEAEAPRVRGDTLTVYSSGPRHGASAAAGEAVFAGQRRALAQAKGRAGGRRIRLVRLTSTRPGDTVWDPGTVEANAQRARKDPSTIAYLGELDLGGSAVSLPVTNRAGLLQVSPTDGLTSLTRTPPGRPRAGPERYYPEGRRTFVRLVASDLVLADALLRLLDSRGVRSVAVLHGKGIADRELAAVLVHRLRRRGREPTFVEAFRDEEDVPTTLVERLAVSRPRAILHVGAATPATRATMAALARRLPAVPVLGSAALAVPGALGRSVPRDVEALTPILPVAAQPPAGRRLLRSLERELGGPVRPEALYGYESMRLVLTAVDRAGPDRRAVARAAFASPRRTVLGPLTLGPDGEVRPGRLALISLRGGNRDLDRLVP